MIHTGAHSPADLGESEPPHIKNWFSSYEYESFVLETNDNFGFSEPQESQDYENECSTRNTMDSKENLKEFVTNAKNESLLIKCSEFEEENTSQKHVLESQDSPSLTPEPVGIENWFSSYVYESPEVDTIDDLIASDHKESTVDCHEKVKEFEKDENLCVTATDDMVCKQVSECNNGPLKDDSNLTDLPNEDVNVNVFGSGSRKVEENENGFVSIKSKKTKYEKSKEVNGVNQEKIKYEKSKEVNGVSQKNIKYEKSKEVNDVNQEKIKYEKSKEVNGVNQEKIMYEKSKEVNGADQERYVFSSINNNNKRSDERMTLRDVTNVVDENSSVTGKWKCPRKRKPDMGPPMKQLRLGQWFRHV